MLRNIQKLPLRNFQIANLSTTFKKNESFKVQDLKDFNERVKNSKKPVIVDFFATWCNPCKALTPRIENVIAEKNGEVILAKVDIDEHTDLALDYDVGSVPVLVGIRNGKVEERLVGLQDTDKLRKFVDKFASKK
uniref:Putative thioredoxin-like protein n=2 Tax=Triatoma infestans TaxID=30076 RepID=A0A023FAV9_TRIIF